MSDPTPPSSVFWCVGCGHAQKLWVMAEAKCEKCNGGVWSGQRPEDRLTKNDQDFLKGMQIRWE